MPEGTLMVDANWLPDPSGTHELRYWNGSAWTEHVSDQGTTGVDAPTRELPLPGEAPPPPPPAPGDTNVLYYGSNDAGFGAPPAGQAPGSGAPAAQAPGPASAPAGKRAGRTG